jgi:hypothetical protein
MSSSCSSLVEPCATAKLADPRSHAALDALAARAREQVARGEVYDFAVSWLSGGFCSQ